MSERLDEWTDYRREEQDDALYEWFDRQQRITVKVEQAIYAERCQAALDAQNPPPPMEDPFDE